SVISFVVAFFLVYHDAATADIYTLSLHDALPISDRGRGPHVRRDAGGGVMVRERVIDIPLVIVPDTGGRGAGVVAAMALLLAGVDRKSTRLNSSHVKISYAVFCLKKKNRA